MKKPTVLGWTTLIHLREAKRITQPQVAAYFGLRSGGRDRIREWENLDPKTPCPLRHRARFLQYVRFLVDNDSIRFAEVYAELEDAWQWPALTTIERQAVPEAQLLLDRLVLQDGQTGQVLAKGSYIPYDSNPHFVGRDPLLRALAATLHGGERVALGQRAATTGLGGIGKTSVAAEFVHHYGACFAGGVFWLSFADPAAVPSEVAACGREGRLALHPTFDDLQREEQVRLVRTAWQETTPRLLIFDNCDDPAMVQHWIPTSGGCRVLITSRRQSWPSTLRTHMYHLEVLDRAASVTLLRHLAPRLSVAEAQTLAAVLGDFPLALQLAGGFLARYTQVTLSSYLEELNHDTMLEHPTFQGEGVVISPTAHDMHVGRTFAASYGRLNQTSVINALARQILACVACMAPGEPIPATLLLDALNRPVDDLDGEDALRRLGDLGFLTTGKNDTVWAHRLVHMYLRTVAPLETVQTAVAQVLIDRGIAINIAGYPGAMEPLLAHLYWRLQQFAPHVAASVDVQQLAMAPGRADQQPAHDGTSEPIADSDITNSALCRVLGEYLWRASLIPESHHWHLQAYQLAERAGDRDTQEQALNLVGLSALSLGDYPQAEAASRARIELLLPVEAKSQHQLAEEYNNLGFLLIHRGRYEETTGILRRSLQMTGIIWDPCSLETARVIQNLGYLAYKAGFLRRAWRLVWTAIIIRSRFELAEHNPALAFSLSTLGEILLAQRCNNSAEMVLRRALVVHELFYPGDHFATAESLMLLGSTLPPAQTAEAEDLFSRATAMIERMHGTLSPLMVLTQIAHGRHALDCGKSKRAHALFKKAYEQAVTLLGHQHPDTATALHSLGIACAMGGDYEAGLAALAEAAQIRTATLRVGHYRQGETALALATMLLEVGQTATAVMILTNAILQAQRGHTTNHPVTRQLIQLLAKITAATMS